MDALDRMIAKNKAAAARVKVTQAEVEREAKFLLGWAKSKDVVKVDEDSTFYKNGKYMTKLVPAMVDALLKQGLAAGTTFKFKMNKDAVKKLGE